MKKSVGLLLFFMSLASSLSAKEIVFDLSPVQNKETMLKMFQPLCDYISKSMNMECKLQWEKKGKTVGQNIVEGKVALAYVSPAYAVRAMNGSKDVVPLAIQETKGKSTVRTMIVTKKESPIKSYKDFKDIQLAYGPLGATFAYYVPRYMMDKAGVDISSLRGTYFAGPLKYVLEM